MQIRDISLRFPILTDQKMNIQLTDKDGTVYSYFVSPKESAVIPFSSGSGTYQVCCYQQIDGSQYAALLCRHSGSTA